MQLERRQFILIPVVCVIYFATAYFGLKLDAVSGFAALVWPPTGIAITALLLFGYPLAIGVFAGALLVNIAMGATFFSATLIASGNTLEALWAVYFLKSIVGFSLPMSRLKDAGWFIFAACTAPFLSSTIGVLSIMIDKRVHLEGVWNTWSAWWVGDVLGALVVAPFLLSLAGEKWPQLSTRRMVEFGILLVLMVVVGLSLFNGFSIYTHVPTNFPYLLLPLVVWAALRFGQAGNTSLALTISVLAVAGTVRGMGPFAQEGVHPGLLLLQGFVGVIASTCMLLAAAIAERNDAILARDEFLSIASHELKTPITSLSLQTQFMMKSIQTKPEQVKPEKLSLLFSASYKQIHRLSQLVDNLMDISRMRSGRLELHIETADVSELIKDVMERVAPQAVEAKCPVELVIQGNVSAQCDVMRFEQVITNLVSNALKYAPKSPLKVTLRADQETLWMEVEDGGPGIPKECQERIFERFERITSTPTKVAGLGLGLFIVQQIVKAHDGLVRLEKSTVGGAKFVVQMPIHSKLT